MNQDQIEFIKTHQGMIRSILQDREKDYLNMVVDEPDLQKKEALSLVVKEFRRALTAVENLTKQKKKVEPKEEFTGV